MNEVLPGVNGRTQVSSVQGELAFFFKVKQHDYHRGKEVALMVGPVIPVPMVQRYRNVTNPATFESSGPLGDIADVNYLAPRMQVSFQFRRPMGEGSLMVEPGAQIGILPEFRTVPGGDDFRRLEVFLSLGNVLWDRRG